MYSPDDTAYCAYCGEEGLHWDLNEDNQWRLYDEDDDPHDCLERGTSAKEEFA